MIENNRNLERMIEDTALLSIKSWSGMKQGNDGYPMKNNEGDYCIAGKNADDYDSTHIELYGIRIN